MSNLARPHHVLIVSNNAWTIVKFRQATIRYLIASGYQVSIVATIDKPEYVSQIQSIGAQFYDVKIHRKGKNPLIDIFTFVQFIRLYRLINPDLIIHYTIKPNIYGTLAARIHRIPTISMITGVGYVFSSSSRMTRFMINWMYKVVLRIPDIVWFTNDSDRHEFVSNKLVPIEATDIMPGSGVNVDRFLPIDINDADQPFTFLMIARLQIPKGVREYMQAAQIIKFTKPQVCFQILGYIDSENPGSLTAKDIDSYVQQGVIEYLGADENVVKYIAQSSCVVLPSYREGLSTTLVEAASMAKPLVASDVPGCNDVVIDKKNGFLCKPADTMDLARAMMRMIELPLSKRNDMGRLGRSRVIEMFDEKILIQKQLTTIESILSKSIQSGSE